MYTFLPTHGLPSSEHKVLSHWCGGKIRIEENAAATSQSRDGLQQHWRYELQEVGQTNSPLLQESWAELISSGGQQSMMPHGYKMTDILGFLVAVVA